jgi:hypothetical protein
MLRASLQLVRPLKAAGSIRLGLNATPFAVRMLGTKGVPSAAVPGQGHVTDTSNSTMFMRDDVGRKTLGVSQDARHGWGRATAERCTRSPRAVAPHVAQTVWTVGRARQLAARAGRHRHGATPGRNECGTGSQAR